MFCWCNRISIEWIYTTTLEPYLNNIEINTTVPSQFKQMCKIILVDYMASKIIECIATLFHPAFTGTKLDRSSSCNKCDECDNKVDNKVIFEILRQLLLN